MSEYLAQLKDILKPQVEQMGYKLFLMGSELRLMKGTQTIMKITKRGDKITITFKGQSYEYDEWYTKPEHLAKTIMTVLQHQKP